MTGKERVNAAVRFQPVDRVPACTFDGGVWMSAQRNISLMEFLQSEDNGAKIILETVEQTDSDIVWVGNGFHGLGLHALGATANYSKVGASGEVGTLFEDIAEVQDHDPSEIRGKLESDALFQDMLNQIRKVKEAVGDEKYLATCIGAPFTLAGSMIGVQNFMEALFDEDENLPALYDYAVALTVESARLCMEAGATMVGMGDPVASGDLISQSMFEEFALPLEKRAFDALDDAEIRLLHICGNTLVRLESLQTLPIDAFSLDSVDLAKALEGADGKYAIFGNLSPFAILQDKSAEEIAAYSKSLCDIAGKNGGFILAPGCDITPDTELAHVQAMINAAKA